MYVYTNVNNSEDIYNGENGCMLQEEMKNICTNKKDCNNTDGIE